jgi:hypothetical protein
MKIYPATLELSLGKKSLTFRFKDQSISDYTISIKVADDGEDSEIVDGISDTEFQALSPKAQKEWQTPLRKMLQANMQVLSGKVARWLRSSDGYELMARADLCDCFTLCEQSKVLFPAGTEAMFEKEHAKEQMGPIASALAALGLKLYMPAEEPSEFEKQVQAEVDAGGPRQQVRHHAPAGWRAARFRADHAAADA